MVAGKNIQTGAKGAADSFNKFVEGQDEKASAAAAARRVEPERKDFWDSFGMGAGGAGGASKPASSIGTSAMKKTPGSSQKSKDDGWGDDW